MLKKILYIITIINLALLYPMEASCELNQDAEFFISKSLERKLPYDNEILNCKFRVNNGFVYPPGGLAKMFANFLINNNLIKYKVVADISAGCFPLGIIAAKNGAKKVVGTAITHEARVCANENIQLNHVKNKTYLYDGIGASPLLPLFKNKVDIVISGGPWDTIAAKEFDAILDSRKPMSRYFYDINDEFITDVISQSPKLLKPNGRIFITACKRIMPRIHRICSANKLNYKIVQEEDYHKNGNPNYILEIIPKSD